MNRKKFYLLLSLLFLLFTTPLIWLEISTVHYEAYDEDVYHLRAIRQFSEEFPHFDLVNYKLAMTPLYHIMMVFMMKIFGLDLIGLRLFNLLIGLACLLVLYNYLSRGWSHKKALLTAICIMLSPYFIGPSVRLSTDNMGFLFALLALMQVDNRLLNGRTLNYFLASIFIMVTVLTRHIYVWLAGAGIYSAFCHHYDQRLKSKLLISIFFLIPILTLVPFFLIWGDITPPNFADKHKTTTLINLNVIVYAISVCGFFGSFFFFWFIRFFRDGNGRYSHIIIIYVVSGLLLFIHPVVSAIEQGTGDGFLWKASVLFPSLNKSSVVFWVLFPLGLCYIYAIFLNRRSNSDYFILIVMVLWLIVNSLSALTWHKYYEPFFLFFICYSIRNLDNEPKYYWIGPIVLIFFFLGVDIHRYLF